MNALNLLKLQAKKKSSAQFKEVADMIEEIANLETMTLSNDFAYLARDPWNDQQLVATVQNIDTTSFCQLFSMKSTSCGRHLRLYKELTAVK